MDSKIGIDMDSLWELGRDLTEVRSALRYYQNKHVLLLWKRNLASIPSIVS